MDTRAKANAEVLLALLLTPGVGNVCARKAAALANELGRNLKDLIALDPHDLADALPPGTETLRDAFASCSQQHLEKASAALERVADHPIEVIDMMATSYPAELDRVLGQNAPPLLFTMGNLALIDEPRVAVVGAREVSPRGAALADECATIYADHGATIVSGGAEGVDTVAHEAALQSGGNTIVILPQGILTYEPPETIAQGIQSGHALILSAFTPYARWQRHAAVTRNAYISALAQLVCVIEPRKTGGSIRTARCAIEQGKRVLYYCDPQDREAKRLLANTGASKLTTNPHKIDPGHLIEMWRTAPASGAEQGNLF